MKQPIDPADIRVGDLVRAENKGIPESACEGRVGEIHRNPLAVTITGQGILSAGHDNWFLLDRLDAARQQGRDEANEALDDSVQTVRRLAFQAGLQAAENSQGTGFRIEPGLATNGPDSDGSTVASPLRGRAYCAGCGNLATGEAWIGDRRYCHGDDDAVPTCYQRAVSHETGNQPDQIQVLPSPEGFVDDDDDAYEKVEAVPEGKAEPPRANCEYRWLIDCECDFHPESPEYHMRHITARLRDALRLLADDYGAAGVAKVAAILAGFKPDLTEGKVLVDRADLAAAEEAARHHGTSSGNTAMVQLAKRLRAALEGEN